jgi:hypothetical protein
LAVSSDGSSRSRRRLPRARRWRPFCAGAIASSSHLETRSPHAPQSPVGEPPVGTSRCTSSVSRRAPRRPAIRRLKAPSRWRRFRAGAAGQPREHRERHDHRLRAGR